MRPEKFAGRPGRDYTVVGKGGLVGRVRIPDDLADRLEAQRCDELVRVTDRGIHYTPRYDVAAGTAWGASFTGASMRALGWTRGAHGMRHGYAHRGCGNSSASSAAPTRSKSSARSSGIFAGT